MAECIRWRGSSSSKRSPSRNRGKRRRRLILFPAILLLRCCRRVGAFTALRPSPLRPPRRERPPIRWNAASEEVNGGVNGIGVAYSKDDDDGDEHRNIDRRPVAEEGKESLPPTIPATASPFAVYAAKPSSVEPFESQALQKENEAAAVEGAPSSPSSFDFDALYVVFSSAIIGTMSGFGVCFFKLSIEALRELLYGSSLTESVPVFLIPAAGGLAVGALVSLGKFAPGLLGTVNEIDALSVEPPADDAPGALSGYLRKPLAAIATLGSGNSLGPEGPSVEVGMSIGRIFMPPTPLRRDSETYREAATRIRRNRLLLSAGAAAGVAAGFNAPLSGVFFALEIVQQFQPPLVPPPPPAPNEDSQLPVARSEWFQPDQPDFLAGPGSITAILLASAISALVSQVYLGNSLALHVPAFDLKEPLMELPLYLMLGIVSGFVAGAFSALAQLFKGIFDGEVGPAPAREAMAILPNWSKPAIGGLVVGSIGTVFPQVLFFGYENLDNLLAGGSSVGTELVLSLLVVKTFATAISAGSGLVGGTFAPSLFLGGMAGASFHNVIGGMLFTAQTSFQLADVQAYELVGAAGVLAALFRAPLTASLLLFELTREYEVILPVVVAASIGSVIGDLVEKNFEEKRRDRDGASWGDLSDGDFVVGEDPIIGQLAEQENGDES